MLYGSDIPELVQCVDAQSFRVYAPAPVLFLCGGKLDVTAVNVVSLREAFTRIADKQPFDQYETLLAEEVNGFFPNGDYRDILTFEADLAQVSELIVLFSESYGSAAELGAFAMVEEIAKRMLVVMDDENYSDDSFIKLGPIRSLEKRYGDQAICVLNRNDIGIHSILNVASLNMATFSERMGVAIAARSRSAHSHTTFNPSSAGHITKLIVGLIQHYGSLYLEEIELFLDHLGIKLGRSRLQELLLCAELVRWIVRDKRGLVTYFTARSGKDALSYRFKEGVGVLNKERWRADIVQFWKSSDPDRFSSIQYALGVAR